MAPCSAPASVQGMSVYSLLKVAAAVLLSVLGMSCVTAENVLSIEVGSCCCLFCCDDLWQKLRIRALEQDLGSKHSGKALGS